MRNVLRHRMKNGIGLGLVLGLTCIGGVAWSRSSGMTGNSGKQGNDCSSSCHQGGPSPQVKLDGPLAIDAGTLVTYTLTVRADAAAPAQHGAGFNVAASDDVVLGYDGGGIQKDGEELTHTAKRSFTAGVAQYTFTLNAPYGGTVSLYGAGNWVNGDGDNGGDQAARDQIDIVVTGPPKPAPPPTTIGTNQPPPSAADAGGNNKPDGGGGGSNAVPSNEDDGGCSIGWADSSSVPAGAVFAGLGLALTFARRRRRR